MKLLKFALIVTAIISCDSKDTKKSDTPALAKQTTENTDPLPQCKGEYYPCVCARGKEDEDRLKENHNLIDKRAAGGLTFEENWTLGKLTTELFEAFGRQCEKPSGDKMVACRKPCASAPRVTGLVRAGKYYPQNKTLTYRAFCTCGKMLIDSARRVTAVSRPRMMTRWCHKCGSVVKFMEPSP